jgi:hypothetical protein
VNGYTSRAAPRRNVNLKLPKLDIRAADYLRSRGIVDDVIKRNRIGGERRFFHKLNRQEDAVAFPYFVDGQHENTKYRAIAEKDFIQEVGAVPVLYGLDNLKGQTEGIIVEGEIDCLSVETAGYPNVVSVPNGAQGNAKDEQRDDDRTFAFLRTPHISHVQRWIIAVDKDEKGQALERALALRLGLDRCRRVTWPEGSKDANEVLVNHGEEFIQECIADAKPFAPKETHPDGGAGGQASGNELADILRYVRVTDITKLQKTNDIVKGLLTEGSMSVIYGPSNSGKSFFALNLTLAVARGTPVYGRRTKQGGAIYVAAEAGRSIDKRVLAYKIHHGLIGAHIPCGVVRCPVDLLDPNADTNKLIALAQREAAEWPEGVKLLVIDTLSRAMSGGKENAPEDMTALIRNIDRIRAETTAHVLIVHHSGKDLAAGARGHSSLRAATDTEIEITRDQATKTVTVRSTKQRDIEPHPDFTFRLRSVELDVDEDGDAVTSCVVVDGDPVAMPASQKSLKKPSPMGQRYLEALEDLFARGLGTAMADVSGRPRAVTLQEWEANCLKRGLLDTVTEGDKAVAKRNSTRMSKYRGELLSLNRIVVQHPNVWLP